MTATNVPEGKQTVRWICPARRPRKRWEPGRLRQVDGDTSPAGSHAGDRSALDNPPAGGLSRVRPKK